MEKEQQVIISAPLFLQLSNRAGAKKYHINLNQYRNWHYQVSNNIKKLYCEVLESQISDLKFNNKISLEFILWRKDKRIIDRSNVLCIHEKFFCDALVHYGVLEDDNDSFIQQTSYRTGGIDKDNPRVDIIIRELDG